jgi:hypothetical protein
MKTIAIVLLLILIGTASARPNWTGDTYSTLVRLIGFKPVQFYSSQNFAVEWVNQNSDGSLTVHLIGVS